MNFFAKCCQPPGILGDFAVDRWKFKDFTRPGILRPSPCTDKKWNSPLHKQLSICKHTVVITILKAWAGRAELQHSGKFQILKWPVVFRNLQSFVDCLMERSIRYNCFDWFGDHST